MYKKDFEKAKNECKTKKKIEKYKIETVKPYYTTEQKLFPTEILHTNISNHFFPKIQ